VKNTYRQFIQINGYDTVLCGLRNFRDDPKAVEPLIPPPGSSPGDSVTVENFGDGTNAPILNPKKKIWEKLQVRFF